MKQKFLNLWTKIKQEATRAEVWVKTTAVAAAFGGLNAAHEMYSQGIHFAATPAHYAVLKAKFVEGAVTGVIAFFLKSPLNSSQPKQ